MTTYVKKGVTAMSSHSSISEIFDLSITIITVVAAAIVTATLVHYLIT